uniref:Reverse transcriptase Ty1/copia-type domain-containing protein n=1 Tax=Tanacetum cinerariifolium TaxID=118510 RepID=A0A6L2J0X4_TANCI|nr:hypothetical protein [Tanacetum cinerariifolium]
MVPAAVLTQSKSVFITAVRPVSAVVAQIMVTRPRLAHLIVTKSKSPIRWHITCSQSPKTSDLPLRVTAAQALVGNPQYALKDKGVIDSGCSWRMIGNMSYLFEFEELNGGYVAFGGNPKGGKISSKGKIKTNSLLPIPFWAEAVNTACYVQNRVLVTKPHNKTLYELLHGRTPSISFMRPFGCLVTILNTLDSLGSSPTWLFDIDSLTRTMNYQPVTAGNQTNHSADVAFDEKEHDEKKPESEVNVSPSSKIEDCSNNSSNEVNVDGSIVPTIGQNSSNSTNPFSAAGPFNTTASPTHGKSSFIDASQLDDDLDMPELEDITYSDDENDVGAEDDFNNLETFITVCPISTTTIQKVHPVSQIIGDLSSTTQTRSMTSVDKDQGRLSQMFNDDFFTCMFACFLHRRNPRGYIKLSKIQVYMNKKDERGIVIRNKARLVAQGHTQEEGIDYEDIFASVARIEAIQLFLAYASFMGFMVYQMDVKSAFLYRIIEEEVYVCQPLRFEDPDHPDKVYKVVKSLYGLHQAPRACQDKYVDEILRKFGLTEGKSASTPIDIEKPLLKDPDGEDVDVHIYKSMIGSLLYLTSSRPDIMFAFWNTVAIKQVNDVTRLQALVDKKKVVVIEAAIGESMSAKRTLWNEFSSAMVFAIICLSTGDLSTHTTKYTSPALTQKVFANMRRVGKGFSRVETPLFEGMIVGQEIEEEGDKEKHVEDDTATQRDDTAAQRDDAQEPSIPSPTPPTPQPQPS